MSADNFFCWGGIFLLGVVVGALLFGRRNDPEPPTSGKQRKEARLGVWLTEHQHSLLVLRFLPGSTLVKMAQRLELTRGWFKMRDFVPVIMSQDQWSRARQEMLSLDLLRASGGQQSAAHLSPTGWEFVAGVKKWEIQHATVNTQLGEGGRVPRLVD